MKPLFLLIPSFLFGQVLSIDCGSSSDQYFTGGFSYTIATPGATGDTTLRYGAFSYRIPTAPGSYDVTLHLRETGTVTALGQRIFSVSINGAPALVNFDLFAASGLQPTQKTFTVSSIGYVEINFTYSTRSAIVSRIDVAPEVPPATFPRQVSESFSLDGIPETQDTLTVVLAKTPVPESQLLSTLQSSQLGNDKVVFRQVDNLKPKEVLFLLPFYRPFSGDLIQVLYWTLE